MTEEEIKQSAIMADGDVIQSLYEQKLEELNEANFDNIKHLDDSSRK
jgi:hypothetical protein